MKPMINLSRLALATALTLPCIAVLAEEPDVVEPEMYYTDCWTGPCFAKDPDVERFNGKYFMYYTTRQQEKGIAVGIAESEDLVNWTKAGMLMPGAPYEKNGLGAPCVVVHKGRLHMFYQSYGNGPKDAICHAVSDDGLHFERNPENPIFAPTGDWTVGRAIDADAIVYGGRMLLYAATRDPDMKTQMVVAAAAPLDSTFGRDAWTQLAARPILRPELPWEKRCIEAPALVEHNGKLYMFYAGAYNNEPQQIGVAVSDDGITFWRMSDEPLLPNGGPGEWNASESGHPGAFVNENGQTYLFFQGNRTGGKDWYLSKMRIEWDGDKPYLVRPRDGKEFRLR